MKRRTFLTAAGTVGIVGAASSATVVSSVYNNISLNVLLEEFDPSSRKALDKFVSDITENAVSNGLDTKLAKKLAMPSQIISKDLSGKQQAIQYKNKLGQTISLSVSQDAKSRVVVKYL